MEGGEITALHVHLGIELGDTSMTQHSDLEEPTRKMTINTPVTPFTFAFHNLTYSIKSRRKIKLPGIVCQKAAKVIHAPSSEGKMLLNDMSGEAREGDILGILGPSGSGKSTLLDALANRISTESLKGSVTMNGEILEAGILKMISAYVMQDNLLFSMLTVKETLMFSAEFRLPRSTSKSKKMARVQAVIDELGLRNAVNTLIGDEGHRGISGGERRRVSIGVDIIHGPILLFMDEPTSGLDSSCAFMVVKVLQRIARSGRIVIMSVHQPSSRVVGLLDHLMFLSQGEAVYYGSPTNLSIFLLDFGHPIPENEDRTEFMLDLYRELEGVPGGTQSIVEFNKSWQKAQKGSTFDSDYSKGLGGLSLREALSACILRVNHIYGDVNGTAETSAISEFANPFWVEIIVLAKRWLRNSKRMPKWFILQIGGVVFVGSIIASLFWQLDKTEGGIQERIGFFAFIITTIFFGCTDVLAVFLQDRSRWGIL
ncbi:ABC transporter G family member 20-like isoform X2 [Papaver somniferum]|uniref:ABC transporter G family member 20-like isoform X2 n=1 Tax=Papaver somniferum TaxID=3469 RepID=UPI000E6FCC2C|nr:ABC transporter G family member 20-like isoform X2 [Papaver somniferum]